MSLSYTKLLNLSFFPKNVQFDPLHPTIRYRRVHTVKYVSTMTLLRRAEKTEKLETKIFRIFN